MKRKRPDTCNCKVERVTRLDGTEWEFHDVSCPEYRCHECWHHVCTCWKDEVTRIERLRLDDTED